MSYMQKAVITDDVTEEKIFRNGQMDRIFMILKKKLTQR